MAMASPSLSDAQNSLVGTLASIRDPHERLTALTRYGQTARQLPEPQRQASLLVPGCVSRVYLDILCENDLCYFRMAADSAIVAGLAGAIVRLYSGHPADAIVTEPPRLIEELGLPGILTPTRLNGLRQVAVRVRQLAAYSLASFPEGNAPGAPGPSSPP